MTGIRLIMALLLAALASSATADETKNELTVFGGQRVGGSFDVDDGGSYELDDAGSQGIIFNRRHRDNTHWEILYTRQDTAATNAATTVSDPRVDIDIEQLEASGTYAWDRDRVHPYLAMTLGGTRVESRARGAESDTFLSGSIGLGLRLAPAARLGLRLEMRYHAVLADKDTDLLCRTGPDANTCAVRVEGRALGQVAFFGGVSLRF